MKIKQQKTLSQQQLDQINRLWNEEYPINLANRLPLLIEENEVLSHYIIENEQEQIIAWALDFKRENEISFSIIVSSEYKGKGLGRLLINKLKEQNDEFYGWVIDHDNDLKVNDEKYASPLAFYEHLDFEVLSDRRLQTELISAVKIKWKA